MVAVVCDRFGGYPSDYTREKDLTGLYYDYNLAKALNMADQKNKEAEYSAIYGKR